MTRQAYYQHYWHFEERQFEDEFIVAEVLRIRKKHPRMGGRKLYELLEPFMLEHQIKMGIHYLRFSLYIPNWNR